MRKISKYESQFLPVFNAKIYFSLAKYSIQRRSNKRNIRKYIKRAKYYMKMVPKKDRKSLGYITSRLKQMNIAYLK